MARMLQLLASLVFVAGQTTVNNYNLPICSDAQKGDAVKGIALMSTTCRTTMGASLAGTPPNSPPSPPSLYQDHCPCMCELSHGQFYGFPTVPNCATSSNSDMTVEETFLFCSYGHCACAGALRTSTAGGSACGCSDPTRMGTHVMGTACKAPLTCTNDNNCPGIMKCSTGARRRKMSPLQRMAAHKRNEGRQLFGAPTGTTTTTTTTTGTCLP